MTPAQAIEEAIALAEDEMSDPSDLVDQLTQLLEMFSPYKGDPREQAQAREWTPCHCPNCSHEWPALFFPADLRRAALMALRGAFCPRCFCTEGVAMGWKK